MAGCLNALKWWWHTSRQVVGNEKMYFDYLQIAWEAKKEEAMEAPHNPAMASISKHRVMSFFLLWKLKGSQPAMTPSTWVAHLEEESTNKEEYINGKDPGGIEGIIKEFIVCLARAVKDAQQAEKCCYHCGSPDHFICNCPLVVGSRADLPLNKGEGTAPKKGVWAPQGKVTIPKVPQYRMPQV